MLGIPSICLMESAGAGAARLALELLEGQSGLVVCACGPGNNGGDGMVVARHLAVEGVPVSVALLPPRSGDDPPGDAGTQLAIVRAMGLPLVRLAPESAGRTLSGLLEGAVLAVDALFGTGLSAPLRGAAAECAIALDACTAPVLALDLPSGLDCDTGRPLGPCPRARMTATFVAPKMGFVEPGAADFIGEVRVVGIGAPRERPAEE